MSGRNADSARHPFLLPTSVPARQAGWRMPGGGATADAAATGIRTSKCPPPHGDGHFRVSEDATHSYVASLIVAVALCAAMPSESDMTCTAFASSGVASRLMR